MDKYAEGKNKFCDINELAIDSKDDAYTDDEDHDNTHKFTSKEKFFQSYCSQSINEKIWLKKAHIILLDSKDNLYIKYLQNQPIRVFSNSRDKTKV